MATDGGVRRPLMPVRELPPEVARKIAAGEVIDRPAAVVRELVDNSLDSGADRIAVEIAGGGIEMIRVSDNGSGMTHEDLALCTKTHTTSKISAEDDLLSLRTLGFRGEALSSISAVSRLAITTTRDGRNAWSLSEGRISPARLSAGTVVLIEGLFENFPARRQFLKRPAAETSLCRQTLIEKALAWPDREFRLTVDGKARLVFPRAETLLERAFAALDPREPAAFFYEISGGGTGFTFSAILGSPEVVRPDRRDLMIFVNGRRINEFSLVQALEYGAEGHFPNGGHPFALLFVDIDPSLVDFNIHPAKREVRFHDAPSIHHAVSSSVRDFFRHYAVASLTREMDDYAGADRQDALPGLMEGLPESASDVAAPPFSPITRQPDSSRLAEAAPRSGTIGSGGNSTVPRSEGAFSPSGDFLFLAQALGTFLAVEKGGTLYLIDQHAAHERILYDELMAHTGGVQELLVPYRIDTESDEEDRYLTENLEALKRAGFTLEDGGDGCWVASAVPSRWTGTARDLREDILSARSGPEALVSRVYATIACRAAVKDGDALDASTAEDLARRAFALAEPVCPHGRPLWVMIDREELFRRIRRS